MENNSYQANFIKVENTNRILESIENKLNQYFGKKEQNNSEKNLLNKGNQLENDIYTLKNRLNVKDNQSIQQIKSGSMYQHVQHSSRLPSEENNLNMNNFVGTQSFLEKENKRLLEEKVQLKLELNKVQEEFRSIKQKSQLELSEKIQELNKKNLSQIQEIKEKYKEQVEQRDQEIDYQQKRIRELEKENKNLKENLALNNSEIYTSLSQKYSTCADQKGNQKNKKIRSKSSLNEKPQDQIRDEILKMKQDFQNKKKQFYSQKLNSEQSKKSARSRKSSKSVASSASSSRSKSLKKKKNPNSNTKLNKKVRINLKMLQKNLNENNQYEEETLKPVLKRPPNNKNTKNKNLSKIFNSQNSNSNFNENSNKIPNNTLNNKNSRPRSQTSTKKSWL